MVFIYISNPAMSVTGSQVPVTMRQIIKWSNRQTQMNSPPATRRGGCAMSCPYTRNHFCLGGSSPGGVQTRSKFPGWGTNGRHSPGKKTHWHNCPAIMDTVISLSVAWIGFFSGSDMSSTFDKAANRQFIHAKYPGR